MSRAYDTLHRGTCVLAQLATRSLAEPWPAGSDAGLRSRFVSNCLRELDQFLHVLMDETAPGAPVSPAPAQRNTANKLGSIAAEQWDATRELSRLQALGRSRACLWHCHGLVRRPDVRNGSWMTAGWSDPSSSALRRYAMGERLMPSGVDLVEVSLFYRQLGDRLVGA